MPSFPILRLNPFLVLPRPLNLIHNSPLIIRSPILTINPFSASLLVELNASVDPSSCGSRRAMHSVSPSCVDCKGGARTVSINHISSRFYTASVRARRNEIYRGFLSSSLEVFRTGRRPVARAAHSASSDCNQQLQPHTFKSYCLNPNPFAFIDDSDLRPSRPCPTMPTDGNPSQIIDVRLTMCSRWEYLQQSYSK
jgi:hypothetical protein